MTDIMEARRKGFEERFPTPYFVTFNKDKKGYYSQFRDSTRKRAAECYDAKWIGYNAALDSVCVELPRVPNFDISAEESLEMDPDDYESLEAQHSYMVDVYRECRSAIERAGLKVKP